MSADPRVPPGFVPVRSFPVVHVDAVPPLDPATWDLRVIGAVERELHFTWDEFRALPHATREADFHSTRRWTRLANRWEGVPLRDLLGRARPKAGARFVRFSDERLFDTTIPLETAMHDAVLLADGHDGRPLSADHGAPVRAVVPAKLGWKSCKWVRTVELLERDKPGFWESRGYPTAADPWGELPHARGS